MKKYLYLLAALLLLVTACRKNDKGAGSVLQVKSFWPNSGNPGTIVTLLGSGFTRDAVVSFNGTEAKLMDAQDTALVVLAPAGGSTGIISVKLGDKKLDAGTYTYQALSLHSILPANGPAGTNIYIHGAGFSSLDGPAKVMVNGKEALITAASDTLLVAAVPEEAGTGKVSVTVNGKVVTGPEYVFQQISSIKPLKGGAGTQVVINGTGFNSNTAGNSVTFNGKAAEVVSAGSDKLVVTAPADVATGPVAVVINGQKTIGNVFTVVPNPIIKTVAPLSAPQGTAVVISGDYFSNLKDEVIVTFNGQPAQVTATADKQLIVTVPAGAGTGNIKVTVNNQASDGPLFKEQALGVSKLVPDNGLAGTQVVVKGIGFSIVPANNEVSFNGTAATVTAATDSTLTVTVPVGTSTGIVKVKSGTLEAIGPVFKRAGVMTFFGGPSSTDLRYPQGITVDRSGNVYVTDQNVIKKITPAGTISIFAGKADGSAGNADGTGTDASFSNPNWMTIDAQDNIYVSDLFNRTIRKITPAGVVTTYAKISFSCSGIGIDRTGTVYLGAMYNGVFKLDALGNATKASNSTETPTPVIAVDNFGNIFFTGDTDNPLVFKISGGLRTIYAGSSYGSSNGPLRSASFSSMAGVVYDPSIDGLYVADNNGIRMIAEGQVTTLTGWENGTQPVFGYVDGTLANARFRGFLSLCIDKDGAVYVIDRGNNAVRKIFFK